MNSRLALLLLAAWAGSIALEGEIGSPGALLVVVKSNNTLAIANPLTLNVVAHVPVGPDPHEVVASADGKLAYVSNSGGGMYHTLSVIDLVHKRALAAVDLGPLDGPHGLAFAGGKVWFTAETAKAIGSYDPTTKRVDFVLGTGQNRTHMIFVSRDVQRIVTTNVSSATVTLMERFSEAENGRGRTSDWNEITLSAGKGAEGFDVSPDGREIWVANAQDGTISVINAADKKVVDTIAANIRGANRLKFTPDGKRVFISMLHNANIAVFDASTRREVSRVKLHDGATTILMQPDGSRAYVAITPDDFVAVIDLSSMKVVGRVETGNNPMGWLGQFVQ